MAASSPLQERKKRQGCLPVCELFVHRAASGRSNRARQERWSRGGFSRITVGMQMTEALALLSRSDIDGPRALDTLSAVATAAGQEAANQTLQLWLAEPVNARSALAQAAVMIAFHRTDVAVVILEAAVRALPDHIELLDHLANALVRRADRAGAIALWRRWAERHPNDPMGWYKLGYHLIDHGGAAAGAIALQRARALSPAMTAATANLYTARTLAGQPAAFLLDELSATDRVVCYRTCGVFTA